VGKNSRSTEPASNGLTFLVASQGSLKITLFSLHFLRRSFYQPGYYFAHHTLQ